MKNENTIYDNEKTQYDEQVNAAVETNEAACAASQETSAEPLQEEQPQEAAANKEKRGTAWGVAAAGMGTGVLLGSVASFFATKQAMAAPAEEETPETPTEEPTHPAWSDGEVAIATTVTDDMSFSQAFAAARAEVGAGGAFEWHGNVYGTYLADEWNSMSPAEQQAYNNHFAWSQHHSTTTTTTAQTQHEDRPDIEEIRVDASAETQVADNHASNETHATNDDDVALVVDDDTPEVVVLGVAEHEESGAVIGGMLVDGEEVFLIDIDNDGTFDVLAVDANHDGTFDADEVTDISDQQITVNDLQTLANDDAMLAANDMEPDYVNDANSDAYVS